MRIAKILRSPGHQRRQEFFGGLGQDRWAPAPVPVVKRCGLRLMEEGRGPVVDALAGHAEHLSDLGGGPTPVEFEHGEGPPVDADIVRLVELLTESVSLPMLEPEPAHLSLLPN